MGKYSIKLHNHTVMLEYIPYIRGKETVRGGGGGIAQTEALPCF